jgi:nitrate/nitrite transporter NarK
MTVILADEQFNEYYSLTPSRQGVVAIIPWASTAVAQLFLGGMLAHRLGRLWSLRISIVFMCLGM